MRASTEPTVEATEEVLDKAEEDGSKVHIQCLTTNHYCVYICTICNYM